LLGWFSTLKMEVIRSSEMWVHIRTTLRYISEYDNFLLFLIVFSFSDWGLQGCDTVKYFRWTSTFRSNMLPQTSGSKCVGWGIVPVIQPNCKKGDHSDSKGENDERWSSVQVSKNSEYENDLFQNHSIIVTGKNGNSMKSGPF
jgi:hypothetical protein